MSRGAPVLLHPLEPGDAFLGGRSQPLRPDRDRDQRHHVRRDEHQLIVGLLDGEVGPEGDRGEGVRNIRLGGRNNGLGNGLALELDGPANVGISSVFVLVLN